MKKRRFELSKSPVDGMIRKWELVRASACRDLITGEPLAGPDDYDYDIWVVTGVYKRRKDVFAEMKGAAA